MGIIFQNLPNLQPEERQKRIEQYLARVEFASLEELALQVSASPSTVRRDLNLLEAVGHIKRTHGGARLVAPAPAPDEYIFSQRETVQLADKEAIGRTCASLISSGQSVIVDAGTTAFQVARQLEGKSLQIITNSLPVASLFASTPSTEVIVSGGIIYPRLGVLVGPLALDTFSRTHADVAIMSGGGITADGVTNSHALLIDIQRAMIAGAGRVIFCFDHTKIGRRSVAHLCELSDIDLVITDPAAPPEIVSQIRAAGVEVLVAGADPQANTSPVPATPVTVEVANAETNKAEEMSWD